VKDWGALGNPHAVRGGILEVQRIETGCCAGPLARSWAYAFDEMVAERTLNPLHLAAGQNDPTG
jgi:hypothetical protein